MQYSKKVIDNNMLDKKEKLCKSCNKQPPMTGRKDCLKCINSKQKKIAMDKKTKEKTKIKARKEKATDKKRNSISYLTGKADDLWRDAVKINYGYRCAYCNKGNDEVQLHSHHLFTRSRKSTRFDIDNGICLCASHHTLSSEFSAHKTGNEFFLWLEGIKGRQWIDDRMKESQKIIHMSPDFIKEQTQKLKDFIANNSLHNMNKSKFQPIYKTLSEHGYDFDIVKHNTGYFRIHVYKNQKEHLITWKGTKEQHEEFGFMVKKWIYENSNK